MHTPPLETRRSSHLTRTPLLAFGPGGVYVAELYAAGGQMVHLPDPAPPAPGLLRPTSCQPTATSRQPWRWSNFWLGVGLAVAFCVLLVAFLFTLAILPMVVVAKQGRL